MMEASTMTEATPTQMVTERRTSAPSGSGGGSGSLEVNESELVVDEGQYTTDVAMTGLLENTGSGTLRLPEIKVSFYDENDSILSNSTRSIVFLKPGDKWDVRVGYFDDPVPDHGEIEVVSTEVYQTDLGIPEPLELTEDELSTGTDPTLSATLKNTSNNPIDPVAFAVFYAEDSVALAGAFNSLDGLPGGESWSVTLETLITMEDRAKRITDYTLYANVL